jgi:hypothetical protein
MVFKYSTRNSTQNELDSLPRIPLVLTNGSRSLSVIGLVDSGATINVIPHAMGLELGGTWDDRKANLQMAGNLSNWPAMPFSAMATIDSLSPVKLVFAWVRSDSVPLILGQTNFFAEFRVCFDRAKFEFEVMQKVK